MALELRGLSATGGSMADAEHALAEVGAETLKDMGKVMGLLKQKYTGQMDFGKAGARVKEKLG